MGKRTHSSYCNFLRPKMRQPPRFCGLSSSAGIQLVIRHTNGNLCKYEGHGGAVILQGESVHEPLSIHPCLVPQRGVGNPSLAILQGNLAYNLSLCRYRLRGSVYVGVWGDFGFASVVLDAGGAPYARP